MRSNYDSGSETELLRYLCKVYEVPKSQILEPSKKNLSVAVINNNKHEGLRNIIKAIYPVKSKPEEYAIGDWAEFCSTDLFNLQLQPQPEILNVLKGLNNVIRDRTCLVGYRVTVADILVYFFINSFKERPEMQKFVHIRRWLDFVTSEIDSKFKSGLNFS